MKNKLIYMILIFSSFVLSDERSYSTTTFDYLWNSTFKRLKFRDPISFSPFELRVGVLSYGGSDYWDSNIIKTELGSSLPVILDSTTIDFNIFNSDLDRRVLFLEADFFRLNLTNYFYRQNLFDLQFGLGYKRITALSNLNLPKDNNWSEFAPNGNTRGIFTFRPKINDLNINTSFTLQVTNYLLAYAYHSLGYSFGSLYESTGGDYYLRGSGINESLSLGIKFAFHPKKQKFSFIYGFESRWNRTVLSSLEDPSYISHINGLDMFSKGIFVTFGTMFGGKRSSADRAYTQILNKQYSLAAVNLEDFIDTYSDHSKLEEANELLQFCYKQKPYQYFRNGLESIKELDLNNALNWLNKASETANSSLLFEIESRKRDLAIALVDSVLKNKNKMTFNEAEDVINRSLTISPKHPYAIEELSNLYIEKGQALYTKNNYFRAKYYFNKAEQVYPDNKPFVMNKYNDLVESLMEEANKFSNDSNFVMAIYSLESIIDIFPFMKDELFPKIEIMNKKLKIEEDHKTKQVISKIVDIHRENIIPKDRVVLLLGMTTSQVKNITGDPDFSDVLKNSGIVHELWSFQNNPKIKRLYFENHLLVKIEK